MMTSGCVAVSAAAAAVGRFVDEHILKDDSRTAFALGEKYLLQPMVTILHGPERKVWIVIMNNAP
jgi:hypothetical protein